MDSTDFTRDPQVVEIITRLVGSMRDTAVSDIVDDEGHQYVDLVMEGGGVLGLALLGYTYALEQVGIRFMGVGGTSAGSISAMLLAAVAEKHHDKSERLLSAVASKDFREFVDGDDDARDLIDAALSGAGKLKLIWKGAQVLDNLGEDLGLNPGDAFLEWMKELLEQADIRTTADLRARMAAEPKGGLRHRNGAALTDAQKEARLALISAEVTTETKVEFPRMARLFWENPDDVNPALFVRASMSIPFFFHPFRVRHVPQTDAVRKYWEEDACYSEPLPKSCMFMDGGIMSNFPIDVFHQPASVPAAPTFGVKLGTGQRTAHRIDAPGSLVGAVFNSARHCLDYDFITRNPDYQNLVQSIDTGSHNWLNFSLSNDDKIDLFRRGVEAAADFLGEFNWTNYKKLRVHLAQVYAARSAAAIAAGEVVSGNVTT